MVTWKSQTLCISSTEFYSSLVTFHLPEIFNFRRQTAVSIVSFETIIWSGHTKCALSPTGNRGCCMTRPNNSCKGDYSDIEDTYPFRQASAQLHLIIQFPVLYTSGKVEDHVLKRQAEYIYSLQKNLQSPHVAAVHILCEKDKDPIFIKAQNLEQDWKLDFIILGRRMHYKDAFEFASKHLIRKNVMVMNSDCYIHRGFEKLDESILSRKTMYALTRHESEENIHLCDATDLCGPKSKFQGSHDGFLFRLLTPVSPWLLDEIDYRPNIGGIEQVLIFNFRKYGGFKIKNPCKILHIVHHHCSGVRNETERVIQGQRIDDYLHVAQHRKLVLAEFSGL